MSVGRELRVGHAPPMEELDADSLAYKRWTHRILWYLTDIPEREVFSRALRAAAGRTFLVGLGEYVYGLGAREEAHAVKVGERVWCCGRVVRDDDGQEAYAET